MRENLCTVLRGAAVPIVLLTALEMYARGPGKASETLAPPTRAVLSFAAAAGDGSVAQATFFTLGSAAGGLAMSLALALVLGSWLGLSERAGRWGFLTVEVLRPVPSVALIPLALLVFGFGARMELSVVAFATFWPMLILVQAAARQVDAGLIEVADALNLSATNRLFKIVLPAMMPRLFVALRLGVAIAMVVAVTVEIAANPHGLGYAIMLAQQSLDPALMLAWLFWIAVVGYAVNALTLFVQRRVAQAMGATP